MLIRLIEESKDISSETLIRDDHIAIQKISKDFKTYYVVHIGSTVRFSVDMPKYEFLKRMIELNKDVIIKIKDNEIIKTLEAVIGVIQ